MTQDQSSYADKIAKLLAKAESASTEAEADAFMAKAQELMTKYAIDEELIARARGTQRSEVVVEKNFWITSTLYHPALTQLVHNIALQNNCTTLRTAFSTKALIHLIGFESDVARVQLLFASLELQAMSALKAWWKTSPQNNEWYSQHQKNLARRSFLFGFADGVAVKLARARRAGETAAAEAEAERSDTSIAAASESVALVLRTKTERVQDWVDSTYGKLGIGKGRSYRVSSGAARRAGQAAGQAANVGTSGLAGSRKAIR